MLQSYTFFDARSFEKLHPTASGSEKSQFLQ